MYLAGESHGVDEQGLPIRDEPFLVVLHAGDDPIEFALPGAPYARLYRTVVDTTTGQAIESDQEHLAGKGLTLEPRSMLVFHAYGRYN